MPDSTMEVERFTKEVAEAKKRVDVAEAVLKREKEALKTAEKRLADAKASAAPTAAKNKMGFGSLYGTTAAEKREAKEVAELAAMAEHPATWASYGLINELRSLQVESVSVKDAPFDLYGALLNAK